MSTSKGRRKPAADAKVPEGEATEQKGRDGAETIDADTVKKGARIAGDSRSPLEENLTKK